jgi:hypothetical protein
MQPADILREGSFPGDGHRQEQRVETSIIEAFADIVACRQYQPLMITGDIQCCVGCLAVLVDMPPLSITRFLTNGENLFRR